MTANRRLTLRAMLGAAAAATGLGKARNIHAAALKAPPLAGDEDFMRLAIAEAARGDFPFGAVIVSGQKVLASGRNLGKTLNDPTAHAEMVAIRRFLSEYPAGDLKDATLYASGEPCPMCMGAILWCGIGRVVFAASIDELSAKIGQIMMTSETLARAAPFSSVTITGGVLSSESLALFSE
ncbi:MAG TPA: nucleoside deaminase [Methylocella sp.]|nr:nucleoside deaminase [Methylocella sp.]